MKWISYNIFQNFPLFRIHRVGRTGVSFALILVLAIKICSALMLIFTFLSTLLKYMVVAALCARHRCRAVLLHQLKRLAHAHEAEISAGDSSCEHDDDRQPIS